MRIRLLAKTTQEARREIAERFPQGANCTGYDKEGKVAIRFVVPGRKLVAGFGFFETEYTSKRRRAPVWFDCEPREVRNKAL